MSDVVMNVDKRSPLRQSGQEQMQAHAPEQETRKCGQKAYSKMTAEELVIAKAKRGTNDAAELSIHCSYFFLFLYLHLHLF